MSDLTYAWRSLAKTPGVTALMIVTLGLGIGANTAIFSFLNELLLRPLPYHDPDRLVVIGRQSGSGGVQATTPRDFAMIRDRARLVESVATMFGTRGENVETSTEPLHVAASRVTKDYFQTLGIQPLLGRSFLAEEDAPNGPKVVVLGYQLWQRAFQGDRNVVGKTVRISSAPHTVIGIMPETFSERMQAQMWLPLQTTGRGNDWNYTIIARLAPGVTIQQASAEAEALCKEVDREVMAQAPPGQRFNRPPAIAVSAREVFTGEFRKEVLLLYGAVCLVLFVACLNTANLLLARSAARSREIAVRGALGAGRWRIVRQLLTESVLLSIFGGVAGIALGKLFVYALTSLAPYEPLQKVDLHSTTLLFTLGVSVLVGLLFGLAPAFHASRMEFSEALKESGGKTSAGKSALRGRQLLMVGQTALCTVLLVGAGLLVRTFLNLRAIETGFDHRNLLTASMKLNADKLESKEGLLSYYDQALSRIRAIPGVVDASVTTQLPVEGQFNLPAELPDSSDPQLTRSLQFRLQTPSTFQVLGMKIVRGRDFSDSDRAGAPPVAIVNEAFGRRFFPGQDVLGKRITMKYFKLPEVWTVTGVINDVREMGLKQPAPPAIYLAMPQVLLSVLKGVHGFVPAKWVIRVRPGSGDLVPQIRQAAGSLDPAQPFQQFRSMDSLIGQTMLIERFLMTLAGAFAALTLVMVASGLYGTLAYAVTQRRQEIGIRMAIGARAADVVGMIVRSGIGQVAAGLALGLIASYWTSKLMAQFLFNLSALDPASLIGTAVVLILVALLASAAPSVNAARTDPLKALRVE